MNKKESKNIVRARYKIFTCAQTQAQLTLANGSSIHAFGDTVQWSELPLKFDVVKERKEFDHCLKNWDSFIWGRLNSHIYPKIIDLNKGAPINSSDTRDVFFYDKKGNIVSDFVDITDTSLSKIHCVLANQHPADFIFSSPNKKDISILHDIVFKQNPHFADDPEYYYYDIVDLVFAEAKKHSKYIN